MKQVLVPSYPAPSYEKLVTWAESLRDVTEEVQVDLVDGVFAQYRSWPFTEVAIDTELKKLEKVTQSFNVELDCMVQDPEKYLTIFAELKIARLIIHVGSTHCFGRIAEFARKQRWKLGLAFTNDVPLSYINPYIDSVDYVQVMGIATVGKQGQAFDTKTIDTVKSLKAQHPRLEIAVDGSVNKDTIPLLQKAGVSRFAPGSAISNAQDPKEAYKQLQALLET